MAFWDQTGDADGSAKGNYFSGDGEYDVMIQSVKHRNGFKGESVIVNVEVLSSNNEDVAIGQGKSCAFNISKQPILALNNIKSFVCGIYGLDANKKDPDTKAKVNHVSKRMVEVDNPLCGLRVHLTTFMTKTQRGGDFTNLDWAPYTADGYKPPMPGATASLGAPAGAAAPAAAIPPPPPPPAAPAGKPWDNLPVGWTTATHYYTGSAWVAK